MLKVELCRNLTTYTEVSTEIQADCRKIDLRFDVERYLGYNFIRMMF